MTNLNKFVPPTSGRILREVVDALQLRQWDPKKTLKNKNTQRYLDGVRVEQKNLGAAVMSIAEAMVRAEFIVIPKISEMGTAPPEVLVANIIGILASRWDELAGALRNFSPHISRIDLAALPFLRLAVVDLALRAAALAKLNGGNPPSETVPTWTRENGSGLLLRELQERCGPRPTREDLARVLEVSDNTIDAWFDGKVRPEEKHIEILAEEFACRTPAETKERLQVQLRRHIAMCDLAGRLAAIVGREELEDLSATFVRLERRAHEFVSESKLPADQFRQSMIAILGLGTEFESTSFILHTLWKVEKLPIWRTILRAAVEPWLPFLTLSLRLVADVDHSVVELVARENNVTEQEAAEALEVAKQIVQIDPTLPPPDHLLDRNWVRIKGDAVYSARNRITQAEWAMTKGDFETAIVHLRRAVELQEQNADYHFKLGAALAPAGMIDEAIKECRIAAGLREGWELPLVEIGVIFLNASRPVDARDELEKLVVSGNSPSTWLALNLGVARHRTGNYEGGLELLELVIEREPDHARALNDAAHCLFVLGKRRKAETYANKAHHLGDSETHQNWKAGIYDRT